MSGWPFCYTLPYKVSFPCWSQDMFSHFFCEYCWVAVNSNGKASGMVVWIKMAFWITFGEPTWNFMRWYCFLIFMITNRFSISGMSKYYTKHAKCSPLTTSATTCYMVIHHAVPLQATINMLGNISTEKMLCILYAVNSRGGRNRESVTAFGNYILWTTR